MQNLDFEVVSKTNHLKAIEIQNLIFPKENGKNDILESLKRKKMSLLDFLRVAVWQRKDD